MRCGWFPLLVLASIFLGSPASAQSSDPARLLNKAVELHNSGKMEEAAKAYEEFLRQVPKHPGALSNLGAVYVRLGRLSDAIRQYQAALELDPRNAGIRFNLSLAYYKMGRLNEAISGLKTLLKDQPGNQNAVIILADCYLQSGQNRQVIDLLSPLESSSPTTFDLPLAYLLGTALIRDGEAEKGQLLVERILKHGDSAEARLMLGTACLIGKDYPGALVEFERAVELNPRLPSAHAYYGQVLNQVGRAADAVAAFKRELEINPYDFDANLYLGVHYYQEKQDYQAALASFQRALGVRPGTDAVRFQIAMVYLNQGQVEKAKTLLEDIVRTSPSFQEAHASLATVYYRLRRKEDGDRHRAIVERLKAERQSKIEVPGEPK